MLPTRCLLVQCLDLRGGGGGGSPGLGSRSSKFKLVALQCLGVRIEGSEFGVEGVEL